MKRILLSILILVSATCFAQVTTTLDGSSSSDPDGTIPANGYKWSLKSSNCTPCTVNFSSTSTAKPSASFTVVGVYQISLFVTDNEGLQSDEDIVLITVSQNQKPKANAGPDQNLRLTSMLTKTFKHEFSEDSYVTNGLYVASVVYSRKKSDNNN